MNANDLLVKADAIADMICSSEAAVDYWRARDKMANHDRAQQLFEKLKLKTNNSLGLQQSVPGDHPMSQKLQAEIRQIEDELHGIPVAIQYKEAQAELNELMQGVMSLLYSRLSEQVPVEYGPRQGCGKGPDGNGCNCGGEGHH